MDMQDATQITLISTWLVEIFINRLNVLRDELNDAAASVDALSTTDNAQDSLQEARANKKRVEEEETVAMQEFRQFLQTYQVVISPKVFCLRHIQAKWLSPGATRPRYYVKDNR